MLMGRRTYEYFSELLSTPSNEYAAAIYAIPNYVFSSTLKQAEWNNTRKYAPAPPFDSGTPDRASAEVLARVRSLNAKAALERRAALERAREEIFVRK